MLTPTDVCGCEAGDSKGTPNDPFSLPVPFLGLRAKGPPHGEFVSLPGMKNSREANEFGVTLERAAAR